MEKLNELIDSLKSKEIIEIGIALGVFTLFILFSSIFAKVIMRCFNIRISRLSKKSKVYRISRFIFMIIGTYVSLLVLGLPSNFMSIITKIFKLSIIFSMTKLIANLIQPDLKILNKMTDNSENTNKHTVNFAVKFVRGIIYVIGAFIFIAELGYDLSGLITGLGIGSVVIALAAQDLAKNLFGGFAILTDKAFTIGDVIETKGIYGTVEDITFRTTRIRKLDNTVVTMPNSILADSDIINWNKIEKRRYDCRIKLSLETTQTQINDIRKKIILEFQKNKNIISESIRAYFEKIDVDGYVIKIYLYTKITDYDDYIELTSEINSQILDLLEKENINIINPTYDINIKNK